MLRAFALYDLSSSWQDAGTAHAPAVPAISGDRGRTPPSCPVTAFAAHPTAGGSSCDNGGGGYAHDTQRIHRRHPLALGCRVRQPHRPCGGSRSRAEQPGSRGRARKEQRPHRLAPVGRMTEERPR